MVDLICQAAALGAKRVPAKEHPAEPAPHGIVPAPAGRLAPIWQARLRYVLHAGVTVSTRHGWHGVLCPGKRIDVNVVNIYLDMVVVLLKPGIMPGLSQA
jgi:hypothetical protein